METIQDILTFIDIESFVLYVSGRLVAYIAYMATPNTFVAPGRFVSLLHVQEQLGDSPALFDYAFSENGLLAFKDGQKIGETSHLGCPSPRVHFDGFWLSGPSAKSGSTVWDLGASAGPGLDSTSGPPVTHPVTPEGHERILDKLTSVFTF